MSSIKSRQSTETLAKLRIERAEYPRRSPRARWRKVVWAALLMMLLIGAGGAVALRLGMLSWPATSLAIPEIMQPRTEVQLATVSVEQGRSADAVVVASGYLESRRQARIGARAPGRIEAIHVEEGSRVKAGEVLAVLEHADLDASLAATRAVLMRAKSELEEQDVEIARTKVEYERLEEARGSISEAEYDLARFEYQAAVARRDSVVAAIALAEARVREAEQTKENMYIRAPFDGTVISKDAEVGESILPGGMGEASGRGSAVTIADLQHLEVECDVKEDYISRVFSEQQTEIQVDALPEVRLHGRVRKVIPKGDRARATIKVQVEIIDPSERLFPDMSATVYFLPRQDEAAEDEASKQRVYCNREAIITDPSGTYVWTVDDQDQVHRVDVVVGDQRDGRTEILEGLSGDERVIIAGAELRAGQRVKIIP